MSLLVILIKPEILMNGFLLTSPRQGMADSITGVQGSHHAKEKKIPDLLSLLHYICNWGCSILWQYTQICVLDLPLLLPCCWLLQVTGLTASYSYYSFKSQLTYITRTTWRKALTVLPFPAWQKGLTVFHLGETPFPARLPLRTEQLLCTDGKTAFLQSSRYTLIFPAVLWDMASHQRETALREDGWFIVQRALQTEP